ncbi:class I SAM-dependent methyltransferase [Colwellia sp. UCD-KL20]|uniref:class I SAM-dependent methyltransferase n=1 Tax=Colwellia sp. UCD-KL20 TaxID=1917165 RepID=UPI000970D606|nr:class I SAM-dependent methyltransferase [Colwellia sp. UCD-KL20]
MATDSDLTFWENSFQDKKAMWGFEPTNSAKLTLKIFKDNHLKTVLIPGFGYGRNAELFDHNGFDITGIEISKTAIEIAQQYYGNTMKVFHGNVNQMPFEDKQYDGIFCYALLHLLNADERKRLIKNCYQQLQSNGYMIFVTLSKNTPSYGEGLKVSEDRFKTKHGVHLFYYDATSIESEFKNYGLVNNIEVEDSSQKFCFITCKKAF